jgi:signal transduction histidine kinase
MTIRQQLSGLFTILVASILTLFSVTIYAVSANYREEEFFDRLERQARTTGRLLINVREVDGKLLKIIDRNTVSALIDEQVLVFDESDRLLYSSVEEAKMRYQPDWLRQTRLRGEWETRDGNRELMGLSFKSSGKPYVVFASAYDQFGRSKLRNLAYTLIWGWGLGIAITVVLGFFFAGHSLRPIAQLNQQIRTITAQDLRRRLSEGKRRDEIDQMAINFNQVLTSLELAFEQQRSFISHASHELRTPIALLKSDVQLALQQHLTVHELREVLQTMLPDIDRLGALTNSLLLLARTLENVNQLVLTQVRLDEVLFAAQDQLLQAHSKYQVDIHYSQLPQTEKATEVMGSESLLTQLVYNVLDNACKYSDNHRAEVSINFDNNGCSLIIRDEGVGIPTEELTAIFKPFYRTKQTQSYNGFGVGLSICRRIVDLHQGRLEVQSQLGQGSTFIIWLPSSSQPSATES